jgi:hypothetical protein
MDSSYEITFPMILQKLDIIDRLKIATTCKLFDEFCWQNTDCNNSLHRIIKDGSIADINRIKSCFTDENIIYAAQIGRIAVFEILIENGMLIGEYDFEKEIWRTVVKYGQLDLIMFYKEKGFGLNFSYFSTNIQAFAVLENRLNILKWMHSIGYLKLDICTYDAGIYLNKEIIEWITSITDDRNADLCEESLKHGDKLFTKWLITKGYRLTNSSSLEGAVKSGDLSVVKWVFKHCPIYNGDTFALTSAAYVGNINIFKYLLKQKLLFHKEHCLVVAANRANQHIIDYILNEVDCSKYNTY